MVGTRQAREKYEKEFKTLSEKIWDAGNEQNITVKNIKEFIKICLADGWDEQFVNPNEHFKAGVQFMKERIIKNAGDKLTK